MDGFEPIGDTDSNQLDRRLLYEVTGLRLFEDEFKGEDSSGSDDIEDSQNSGLLALNDTSLQGQVVHPVLIKSANTSDNSDDSDSDDS